jgi:hypothetical protein
MPLALAPEDTQVREEIPIPPLVVQDLQVPVARAVVVAMDSLVALMEPEAVAAQDFMVKVRPAQADRMALVVVAVLEVTQEHFLVVRVVEDKEALQVAVEEVSTTVIFPVRVMVQLEA